MTFEFRIWVHKPSGISRFLDLAEPSFDFLTNEVVVDGAGGGVTAGSAVSRPSVFLVNEVAIALGNLISQAFLNKPSYSVLRGPGRAGSRRL